MIKKTVAVLGATGLVGQHLVSLLADHPWFELAALAASPEKAGKPFGEAVAGRWHPRRALPEHLARMALGRCAPGDDAEIVFSALDATVAGPIEEEFARTGCLVFSNAASHRQAKAVPLVIPEVNPDHLRLLARQDYGGGGIVTNPNCSTIGLALALAPLHIAFGLRRVFVATLQAISGAGYHGLSAIDIADNAIPLIRGEEKKIETEILKILGGIDSPAAFAVSAQCNRVPVSNGHLLNIAVELEEKPPLAEIGRQIRDFNPLAALKLPSAPRRPLVLFDDDDRPQPRKDGELEGGMAVSIGRLREDRLLDYRFAALVNNLIRGAAGAALLNAELAVSGGN